MANLESNEISEQQTADLKRKKLLKFFYPFVEFSQLLGYQLGSYTSFFMTNVYLLSVTFTASLNLVTSAVSFVVVPLFAGFIDRFQFKKSKIWPWLVIGGTTISVVAVLIMSLPALGFRDASALAPLVFALLLIQQLANPIRDVPMSGVFPRLSSDPKERQYFAMSQKVGRDAGKTIGGYIIPGMIIAMTALSGSEMGGYMYVSVISNAVGLFGYIAFAVFGLRGSYVEREALAEGIKAKKAKVPISAVLKAIVTNRPILAMFLFMVLHKAYFFLYSSYATYVFTYVYGDFSMLSYFFPIFSFSAIVGVLAGPLWSRIFKDSKRSFSAAMTAHVIILAVIAVFFSSLSVGVFLILFGISSFFMGMLENWILPGFAAASDYGAWKAGVRMDNLTMSIYSLSFTVTFAIPPVIGAIVLNSINYTEFVASGLPPTPEIVSAIGLLFSWIPLIIGTLALAVLIFVYNLNDKKLRAIQDDLASGKTKADSELKI